MTAIAVSSTLQRFGRSCTHGRTASADERARFQQRVDELNQKLAEAEAKNQRAKSMAQQTRAGNVYVISNIGSFGEDVLKIGMTRRLEPMDRIYELGDASVPFDFDVHAMITTDDAPTLERELHAAFDSKRVNQVNLRKEFFRVGVQLIADSMREFWGGPGYPGAETSAWGLKVAGARRYGGCLKGLKDAPPARLLNRAIEFYTAAPLSRSRR